MPLTMAKAGEINLIKRITGKGDTKKFLESLGLIEGTQVTVISRLAGSMILNIRETRIALDQTMAQRIMV